MQGIIFKWSKFLYIIRVHTIQMLYCRVLGSIPLPLSFDFFYDIVNIIVSHLNGVLYMQRYLKTKPSPRGGVLSHSASYVFIHPGTGLCQNNAKKGGHRRRAVETSKAKRRQVPSRTLGTPDRCNRCDRGADADVVLSQSRLSSASCYTFYRHELLLRFQLGHAQPHAHLQATFGMVWFERLNQSLYFNLIQFFYFSLI